MKLLCRVHPRGLSVKQQTKVYVRRTVHKESWKTIAPQIKNLEGQTPGWQVCRDTYQRMVDSDNTQDAYANCRRKAVITPDLRKWLIERLLVLRKKTVCTAEVLQRQLASKKRVVVEVSTVRHHLALAGYKWLPRGKKRKYTREQKIERKSFSDGLLAMTPSEMKKHFQFSMDGVVLTVPPTEEIAREMAEGALRRSHADLAVAITGIAGPGGSEHKPEGRVCFGLAGPAGTTTLTVEFGALGRDQVRRAARDRGLAILADALDSFARKS